MGVRCNIQCQYCYQNPPRDAGNLPHDYDLDKMKAAITEEGRAVHALRRRGSHGPARTSRRCGRWGFERYGQNAVQSNGTLITDAHIDLFRRYKVDVGISIDGPGALNDARWAGTLTRTREATARSRRRIERLCQEGMPRASS